ncbi:hypothetical protein TCDM_09480 [Trypanosoma cruzi Dm28c]|uniref:Uncharacterized protein n=1 Tax=Trypanosoma cruzi Dm28c TaxID=1416333 RepID=V5B9V7_TRYCR|nr:hypothetical protein TCDM_09480 [Trypanosoma cruzi Dm28c]
MPCRNHSHRETRRCVWMCAESTATVIVRGGRRGTIRHAPAHTEQRTHTAEQKQRGVRRMTPRAGNTFTYGGHRAVASADLRRNAKGFPHTPIQWHRDSHCRQKRSGLAISPLDASQRPAVAKSNPAEHCAISYVCM